MRRSFQVFRNCFCGLLALSVIASGRVRRARMRAFERDVVTAIYFHKPNRRLFARCISWLMKHGYAFISADELLEILYRRKTPPSGAVWLSFDDGCKELIQDVLPVIRKLKIPVTLFMPTGIISGNGLFPWPQIKGSHGIRDSFTVAELKQVATCPEVTIGSHTVSHPIMTSLTEERIRFELAESKRTLESWINADIRCFAYPEGRFNSREKALLVESGYCMAATTENALINRQTDPYLLPRLSIGDDISFPEAICNMVGVWRPVIDPLIKSLLRLSKIGTVTPAFIRSADRGNGHA
jgi:peptidoglycan/xylan/chitin deacetylase (PgdA/CDA1 family)